MSLVCRRADVAEIMPLRHRVLRYGKPLESAIFPGDSEFGTIHYAAIDDSGIQSCLSMMRSSWEGNPAWQLRGMATDKSIQGKGYGGILLRFVEKDILHEKFAAVFWCNAREVAVPFYVKNGWIIESGPFDIVLIGPHYKMFKK